MDGRSDGRKRVETDSQMDGQMDGQMAGLAYGRTVSISLMFSSFMSESFVLVFSFNDGQRASFFGDLKVKTMNNSSYYPAVSSNVT